MAVASTGHTQICTLTQTHNHASIPSHSFLQAGCPSCCPTNSVKALKALKYDMWSTIFKIQQFLKLLPSDDIFKGILIILPRINSPNHCSLKSKQNSKFRPPCFLIFVSPRIFVTHVASPVVPLDAPDLSQRRYTRQSTCHDVRQF